MRKLKISYTIFKKITNKVIKCIEYYNELYTNKLGRYEKLIQIDKTLLNFKCKSHRGKSARTKIDVI